MPQVVNFLKASQKLVNLDEKNYADSLWDIVESVNRQVIREVREDEIVCKG